MKRALRTILACCLVAFGLTHAASAVVIPSPSNDIALQSNGGIGYSSLGNYNASHTPANLNDGNRDGNFYDSPTSIYHSDVAVTALSPADFGVTLSGLYRVTSINVFDRTDCCSGGLDGGGSTPFTVEVLKNGIVQWSNTSAVLTNSISLSSGGDTAAGTPFTVPGVIGNDVRIIQYNTDYVKVAEVEAFGQHVPEPSSIVLFGLGAAGLFMAARRRRLQTVVACSLVALGLTHAASAATITWGTPKAISGPSDVSNAGTLFDSIMFSNRNSNASTTVNGVTFDRATGASGGAQVSVAGHISTSEDADQPTFAAGHPTGNPNYDALLSNESYNTPADAHNIALSGLTVGFNYVL